MSVQDDPVHNEKALGRPEEDITEVAPQANDETQITEQMREKVVDIYARMQRERSAVASSAPVHDVEFILDKIILLTEQEAADILVNVIRNHNDDPNFPAETMKHIEMLLQGPKAVDLDDEDYAFELRTQAAIIHYHSPYPEVRAISDPFDDPNAPVETVRSYVLGIGCMAAATVINTFFSPRQPAITVSATVLQLMLAPTGIFLAKVLPDWGFSFRGKRISLNPGPWSYKEQVFATIIFTISNGPGQTYYVYLVQRLPQYLGNKWVNFGYEITLALSVQFFGFGFAGAMRRFVIYPVQCIWPTVFPTLALNRALVMPEGKTTANGWRISRYKFFLLCFGAMFLYFWIPNFLFTALHSFNWMTWIAPHNFNLAMITGFYGGMGFNPWATFDWNVSGTTMLVTPFFSTLQQYLARVLSGLIIIAMYYTNTVWAAYTPINSNEAFRNNGSLYNVHSILTNGLIDIKKYKEYGPPFFSGANVFGQGAWFAWYPMAVFFLFISQWRQIKKAMVGMYRGLRYKESAYDVETDEHTKMMRAYKEVPDWWFLVILLLSLVFGIVALRVYPTNIPVWSLFFVIVFSAVFIIPSAFLLATANVSLGLYIIFEILAGVWFVGNPAAPLIMGAYGQNFDQQTDSYLSDLKMAHYAKLPPRAVFRGQMISVLINCFIFIGFLDWMVVNFEKDALCTWRNPQHFVCSNAVSSFVASIEYGAFGVRNMFALYPIFPWCFLMGSLVGIGFGVVQKYGSTIRYKCQTKWMSEGRFEWFDKNVFSVISYMKTFNPAVFWKGSLNWTGGNNLSYATNGMYISFIFMYYIKRKYTPWFERYNYLLESGFDAGVAISGIIQTLAFDFRTPAVSLNWWGNNVSQAGADYESYNQIGTLLPIPEKGYFGPSPENYPMKF